MKKLVCLESENNSSQRFYSIHEDDEVLSMNIGEIIRYPSGASYKILGFVDDIHDDEAARRILYPSEIDEQIALANYIHEISALLCGI